MGFYLSIIHCQEGKLKYGKQGVTFVTPSLFTT